MSDTSVFETCGIKFPLRNDLPEITGIMHTAPKHFRELSEQRADSKLCDVTLIVGEKKLYAHEVVLSSQIPFFRVLFKSNMRESTTREVHLSSVLCEFNHNAIESLINYAYTGLLTISVANVQSLIMGAEYIIDECARFMRDRISVDNALVILKFLKSIAYDKFNQTILKFIDANFVPISHSSDFLELSFEDVRSLLKRDSLNLDDEKQVLEAISRWIEYYIDREKYSTKLLKCVRRFNEKLTVTKIEKTDSAKSNPICIPVRNIKSEIWPKSTRRVCDASHRLIICFGKDSMHIFDPTTSTWTKSPVAVKNRIQERGFPLTMVVHKKIYFIDGFETDDNSGYCFNTVEKTWNSIPCPPVEERYFAATGHINGKIYIAGGHGNAVRLSSMHKFDIAKQEWLEGKAMNYRRCAPAFCTYEERLYVFGGNQDYNDMLTTAEYYDPDTDSWTATSPMAVPRCAAAAGVLGGKIYIVGGHDANLTREEVERYDPVTDTWETLKPLRRPRSCPTLIVSCGRLFLIGGFKGITYDAGELLTVEMYDPETDSWQEISQMPENVSHICALPIPATFATPLVNLETAFSSNHSSGFGCLVANSELLRAIHENFYKHPSEIQHQFLPRAAHGLDVVCQAKAGTGKTTLSAIATLQQLEYIDGQVTALVLCNNREKATKMGETFKDLGKYLPAIKMSVFSGDFRIKKNRGVLLNNCPHIVVGTPGRVLALAISGALKLNDIKQFVVDDCDEMVNDQEIHRDLRKLVKYLPKEKQVMVMSTENSSELHSFCKSLIREVPNNLESSIEK